MDRNCVYKQSIWESVVTRELPPYLRLHTHEEFDVAPSVVSTSISHIDAVANAFEVATGWALTVPQQASAAEPLLTKSTFVKQTGLEAGDTGMLGTVERWRAEQLAAAVNTLLTDVTQLKDALRKREAELAIGVPVSAKRVDEQHLAERLQVMLRNGANAISCQAAGLYLLDDTTTELKMRVGWGLPDDRLLQPPRQLADAFAELEALIGHAVVLEDVSLLPHWKIPEAFPAAICLPVASATDPLGTLWFYADRVRDFSDQEMHLAEIVAGSIAAELQREVLLNECIASKHADRQVIEAIQWQQDHLPNIEPVVDGWEVAGWIANDDELSNGFYDWFVPPDGSLAASVGCCAGTKIEAALGTASLQGSLRSHADHPHDAAAMIDSSNTTVWNASVGGYDASLFYCKAVPDTGNIEFATAGNIHAILVRRDEAELIPASGFQLGLEPEIEIEQRRETLADDDFLVIVDTQSDRPSQQLELARQLRKHRGASTDELLHLVQLVDPKATIALIIQHRDTCPC